MKMYEVQPQPAPHHAIRRDWRVDPARQQRHPAPGNSYRQPARTHYLAGRDVRGVVHYFDRNRQLGRAQIHFKAERLLHFAADRAIDLDRIHREALVLAPGPHRKCARLASRCALDRFARDRFDIARRRIAEREILQTEDQRRALGCDLVAELIRDLHHQARPDAAHIAQPIVAEQVAQILLDLVDESPLITPLERDLVVPADQISHLSYRP